MDGGTLHDGFHGMSDEPSDFRNERVTRTASGALRIWTAIAGMYMMAISTAGLSFVGWRSLDALERRLADDRQADQQFNEGLVQAIERLSESAGLMTSADLCPVKFRLRLSGEHGGVVPMRPVTAELCSQSPDGKFHHVCSAASRQSGLIDFGLREPGRYRVRMEMSDGLTLEHRFEVLPGVPVDCLVRCPGGSPQGTEYSIGINWPPELSEHRLAAVCRLMPRGFEQDGWTWSPQPGARQEIVWVQNCPLQQTEASYAEAIVSGSVPAPGESSGRFTVHSRYWELAEIVFVRLPDSGAGGQPQALGRLQFRGTSSGTERFGWTLVDAARIWECNQPAPQWETRAIREWTLDLPEDAVGLLSLALADGGGAMTSFDTVRDQAGWVSPLAWGSPQGGHEIDFGPSAWVTGPWHTSSASFQQTR
jgi:hypothetical protein